MLLSIFLKKIEPELPNSVISMPTALPWVQDVVPMANLC
jgi:hypothetical protein